MTATLNDRLPGALMLTGDQRRRFDDDGFFLVEGVLTGEQIDTLVAVTDQLADTARRVRQLPATAPVRVNHIAARHRAYRDLLDHPTTLPLVVDLLGPRIQLRGSNLDVRPPVPAEERASAADPHDFARQWHRDEPQGGWPTVDGVVPLLELKIGFYLTDLTRPGSGALRLIPGSHRRPDSKVPLDPPTFVECDVAPGTALVFRTSLLHTASPNYSDHTRRCLYFAYQHRWLRPSDYVTTADDVLEECNPIQRQLLGGVTDPSHLVKDPEVEPCSTFWTPRRADLPLRDWAERHGVPADHAADLDLRTP